MGEISAPVPLSADHQVEQFDCGVASLNDFLKKRAIKNEKQGASRTFVVCNDDQVIGYYSLATGSILHKDAPGKVRRNMPDPIPAMVLGRLAVDQSYKSFGLGKGLLKDAILRTVKAAQHAGIKVLLVHAISEEAKAFYEKNGFLISPLDPMLLMTTLPR
ncbi:GNAT family N-acetyltransferase [Zooshikella ganghwensis]|uniref:N-acetyltransferase n=1 Tax=Zooshikella ganghwensis TaxID=202772 RepID=A0A4P9VNZ3_9GAMM|nr:GNAT family N-acetyltransferase [Zooshikella ganghwensis]RDH43712.1 N-acetyltransferase [Zooshikella ganghwensis]